MGVEGILDRRQHEFNDQDGQLGPKCYQFENTILRHDFERKSCEDPSEDRDRFLDIHSSLNSNWSNYLHALAGKGIKRQRELES